MKHTRTAAYPEQSRLFRICVNGKEAKIQNNQFEVLEDAENRLFKMKINPDNTYTIVQEKVAFMVYYYEDNEA